MKILFAIVAMNLIGAFGLDGLQKNQITVEEIAETINGGKVFGPQYCPDGQIDAAGLQACDENKPPPDCAWWQFWC